jgi:hypothetical protein
MTWLEIVDTAIKIGLGALIGGVFSYLLNKQIYVHEIKREFLLDNRQTLRDVSTKFENTHANVIALSLEIIREFESYKREATKYINKSKSTKTNPKIKIPDKPNFYERRFDTSEKLVLELYSLQGVLMLYGYEKMSSVIYEYTTCVKAISPMDQKGDSLIDIPEPEALQKLNDLRIEFYNAAHYYLNSLISK